MSREIKFRFWYKPSKEMSLAVGLEEIRTMNDQAEDKDGNLIPMQFTGLLDKNGVEIYEGDVIQSRNGAKKLVEWNDLFTGYKAIQSSLSLEVIGNIYEDPELLEQKNE